MKQSDLYIQNSSFETFGLAVCEAIACNCKILLSKHIGALSIIKNLDEDMIINDNTDINEISEKINKIYIKKDEKINYIEDYEKYSWKNEAKKLFDICTKE